jgi:hypothetical protein
MKWDGRDKPGHDEAERARRTMFGITAPRNSRWPDHWRMIALMTRSAQPDLFGTEVQGDLFGAEAETPTYRPDLDSVRARLNKILAEVRAAQELPWGRLPLSHHLSADDAVAARGRGRAIALRVRRRNGASEGGIIDVAPAAR